MKKIINSALAVSGLALAMGTQAATISFSDELAPLTTELTSALAPLTVQQFNSSLGTLNSATLTINYSASSFTTLANTAANPQTFKFKSGLEWLFELSSGTQVAGDSTPLFSLGFTTLASGATLPLTSGLVSSSTLYTLSGADLSAFTGTGTTTIGCNTFTDTSFTGGGGNISNPQQTTASCGVTISYDYSASTPPPPNGIPEPATLGLVGLGLAVLGLSKKRKG